MLWRFDNWYNLGLTTWLKEIRSFLLLFHAIRVKLDLYSSRGWSLTCVRAVLNLFGIAWRILTLKRNGGGLFSQIWNWHAYAALSSLIFLFSLISGRRIASEGFLSSSSFKFWRHGMRYPIHVHQSSSLAVSRNWSYKRIIFLFCSMWTTLSFG